VGILDWISSNSGAGVDFFVDVAGIVAYGEVGATSSSRHSLDFGRRRVGGGDVVDMVIEDEDDDGTTA
jgi:hypothetical protein